MRWPRLKMRTLVGVIAILSIATWWLLDQAGRRVKAVATTGRLGGFVQFDADYQPEQLIPRPSQSRLSKLADRWLGPEFAHDVSVVSLDGQMITDNELASLERIDGLRRLYLCATPITDFGLGHLEDLSGLEILWLPSVQILSD